MFAYCRNNPVRRIDISGTADADLVDEDGRPLESEDIEKDAGAGAPGSSNANHNGNLTNSGNGNGNGTGLPRQGPVTGDPKAPPVDAGKQGKHITDHNNYQPEKSSWRKGQTGVDQTQEAWLNGVPDYRKPGQNVRIGIASDGTIVRVHMGSNGWIHGYPFYPYYSYCE